ncbi:MAG TPA: nucleotidyltransferase domain-containing protein [Caldilineaceae bacterium]|nr:nucleotidyltransferase domain-containing protein [Caldilineaceae bacterium]
MNTDNGLHWPNLGEPYNQALREAVAFILDRFEVWGIIASGSILDGRADPGSDLDIYVVHAKPLRQRVQRWFNGVPCEIFVNPPAAIRRYFEGERDRPSTAAMLATGKVVLDRHPVVAELRAEAQRRLETPPNLSAAELTMRRYGAADVYENAQDIAVRDPANASLILHEAVRAMLNYAFLSANHPLPRVKTMLPALAELDPTLGALARAYYEAADAPARFVLAAQIAERTIQATGFFEWESTPDSFPDSTIPDSPVEEANA